MLYICRGASLTSFAGLRYWYSRVVSSVWSTRISLVSRSVATARPWSMSSSAMRPALCLPRLKIRRLPAMLFCVTQTRLSILWILGPMVTSTRAGSARSSLGMGFLRVAPGLPAVVSRCRCSSSFVCVLAASSGSGRALPLARYASPGGSPAERAVRPLLVVDVLEFGELFVELVDRGRQGTGGEPLLQGAVAAFDLALRLGW